MLHLTLQFDLQAFNSNPRLNFASIMTVLLVDESEIYSIGLKSFLQKIPSVEKVFTINPTYRKKTNLNTKIDLVLCDFNSLESTEFTQMHQELNRNNSNIIIIPTVHSVKDLDFGIFNKYNTPGIIYKSISFRDFEAFILSLTSKKNSNNFINLLEQFAIEKRTSNRLEKKYRFKNILINDELFDFEIKNNNPTNTEPTESTSTN